MLRGGDGRVVARDARLVVAADPGDAQRGRSAEPGDLESVRGRVAEREMRFAPELVPLDVEELRLQFARDDAHGDSDVGGDGRDRPAPRDQADRAGEVEAV